MSIKTFRLNCETLNYHVSKREFETLTHWATLRQRRLFSLFSRNPSDVDAQRIWENSMSDINIAEKMLYQQKNGKLVIEGE